jgi:hypothetical protein
MSTRIVFAIVLSLLSATFATAQTGDIRDKTVIVTSGQLVIHIYIAPSGHIYRTSNKEDLRTGGEYEIGKIFQFKIPGDPGVSWCKIHGNQAVLSGNTLMLFSNVMCNGKMIPTMGGPRQPDATIEFNGDSCTYKFAQFVKRSVDSCKVVTGRQLP